MTATQHPSVGAWGRAARESVLCVGSALACAAWAQTPQAGQAPQPAASANTAPEPAATAPAYQDRLIEGLPPPEPDDAARDPYNAQGPLRFLRAETRLGTQPFDSQHTARLAFALNAGMDTRNHGSLGLDGSLNPSRGDRPNSSSITLSQRGLPLAGGWQAEHVLGVFDSPTARIMQLPSRVSLPSGTVRGAQGEWTNTAQGLQLLASTGQPGQLDTLPAAGFERLPGRRSSLGAQWWLGSNADPYPNTSASYPNAARPGWTAAWQHERAQGVAALNVPGDPAPANTLDASGHLLALRHEGASARVQGQWLAARSNQPNSPSAQGGWLDASFDEGPRTHGLGLYRLEPGLRWADQAMPSDIQGLGLRSEWRTRQWSTEGAIDWLQSISGRTADGLFANGSARWRLDRDASLSVGASLRRFDGNAWVTYADARLRNRLGSGGVRLSLAGGDTQGTAAQEVTLDQDWPVGAGATLSTSLGLARYAADTRRGLPAEQAWNGAISASVPLSSRADVRANLSTEQGSANRRRTGATLSASWSITPRWTLEGNANRNTGSSRRVTSIDPLAPIQPQFSALSDRSFYVVLRYEFQAGSRSVALGGRPNEGGGRVEGVVYFDANDSGTQEANELGVPGALVLLDNRYAVRTDAQGRFEFPFVASGTRTVTLRSDSLPLPWGVVDGGTSTVEVRLRGSARVAVPVKK